MKIIAVRSIGSISPSSVIVPPRQRTVVMKQVVLFGVLAFALAASSAAAHPPKQQPATTNQGFGGAFDESDSSRVGLLDRVLKNERERKAQELEIGAVFVAIGAALTLVWIIRRRLVLAAFDGLATIRAAVRRGMLWVGAEFRKAEERRRRR
jgi:hypothetical protein